MEETEVLGKEETKKEKKNKQKEELEKIMLQVKTLNPSS